MGPASAGAAPGPACYGMGGEEPTVTDAHVVLGHLPGGLLGGRMALDRGLAERAVQDCVARPLGLTLQAAARGILAIADANMMGAIRVVSVERGHDPGDFCLVAFGGAGPLHGCALAELLGITRVLVPPAPGVLCAEGLLAAGLKAEFSRTLAGAVEEADAVEAAFVALERDAAAWLDEERVAAADRRIGRVALMRYEGQGGEQPVAWPGDHGQSEEHTNADPVGRRDPGDRDDAGNRSERGADVLHAARAAFAEAHRRLNGFVLESRVELVTVRVEAEGPVIAPARAAMPQGAGAAALAREEVWFGEERCAVLAGVADRATLGVGDRLAGPAVLTQLDATTLVPPGARRQRWRRAGHCW